jgi:membrane glycosyltransferase
MADVVHEIEQGPVPTAHKQGRQFRTYNVLVIFAMSFASIAMGFSASVIATTLGMAVTRRQRTRLMKRSSANLLRLL